MSSENKPVVFKIRLYPGQDDDLIAWLRGVEGPRGAKSASLKSAWRTGIALAETGISPDQEQSSDLLADIRKVVEAAVSSSLNQLTGDSLMIGKPPSEKPQEETEEILLALDEELLLSAE